MSKGVEVSIPVGSPVEMGFRCPQKPGTQDDWAVLKLRKRAVGIKAYSLPFGAVDLKPGKRLIAVNGRNADIFKTDVNGIKQFPKTIQYCSAGENYGTSTEVSQIESTCASSESTSGSAIIQQSSFGDAYSGVTTGNHESTGDSRAAVLRGSPNTGVYRPGEWGSIHVRLAGRFLSAVKTAVNIEPGQ